MKYIQSKEFKIVISKEETRLKLYQIVSKSYIRVNDGVNTILQLYGCVVNIYQLLWVSKSIKNALKRVFKVLYQSLF